MTPHDDKKLEQFIHQTLRDLPARRAPHSLQHRVLAAIEARAALPWWHKSFVHWPMPARAAFLLVSAGLIAMGVLLTAGLDFLQILDAVTAQFAWVKNLATVVTKSVEFVQIVIRSIPTLWLYGGLAVIGALYAALFGLGAAAYRTLIAPR